MTFIASKAIRKVVYWEVYERDTLAIELAREFRIELVQMPRKALRSTPRPHLTHLGSGS